MAEKAQGVELATGYISLTVSLRDSKQAITRQLEQPLKDATTNAAKSARAELDRELAKVKPVDLIDPKRVGKGAQAVKAELDAQLNGLRQQAAKIRGDLEKQLGGTRVDVGRKIGDDIEDGAGRASRALGGINSTSLEQLSTSVLGPLTSQLGGLAGAAADMGAELAFAGSAIGPQAAVVVGIAAIAGGIALANAQLEEYRKRNLAAIDAAEKLATATEPRAAGSGTNGLEQFRRANEETIATLRNLTSPAAQRGYLVQIGYELVRRGESPEDALRRIRALAASAGVEVPVTITVGDLQSFRSQLDGIRAQAEALGRRIAANPVIADSFVDNRVTTEQQVQLDNLAKSAADAFATGDVERYAAILSTVEQALGDNKTALNGFIDESQKLTTVQDLNLGQSKDTVSALRDLASGYSNLDAPQKRRIQALLAEADAQGRLGPAAIAAVVEASTAQATGAAAADRRTRSIEAQEKAEARLADRLQRTRNELDLLTVGYDAADAAIAAYSTSIDKSTRFDDKLSAGLEIGGAIREFKDGLFGTAKAESKATSESERLNKALGIMKDAVGRLDPKFSALGLRLGSLAAGADGFRKSIADSTGLDNQLTAAVDLGDAWEKLRKVARRLPPEFDAQRASLGKYVPETREALRTLTQLGQATTNYLATLIETGRGHEEVRAEAARLRAEYEAQFRAIGLTEEQVQNYIRTLGLAPDQVETAIEVSGVEEARFKVQALLQLLEGKIPAEVATRIAARVGAGDIEGAAADLARFAASNPITIDVKPEVKPEDRIELPDVLDPSKAALGLYTEEQQKGIDQVLKLRDATKDWLALVTATEGPDAAVREAIKIRQGLGEIFTQLGLNQDQQQQYMDLITGTPESVQTAVILSGAEQAMATIQLYNDLLGREIPKEVRTDVAVAIAQGDLPKAQRLIEDFVSRAEALRIQLTANLQIRDVLTPGGMVIIGGSGLAREAKAAGGPVKAGTPYLVGEQGPELVVPKAAAQVLPATVTAALVKGSDGASSGSTYQFGDMNFYGVDATEAPEEFARRLRISEREARR